MNNDNTTPKIETTQTTSESPSCDAACYASFYSEDWLNHGYTIKDAVKAKDAYESWSGELLGYDDVNYAITGNGQRSGLFGERISAFFAGFRLRNPV